MTLGDLGEFGFIRRFASLFNSCLEKDIKGIGDDCAIIPYHDNLSLIITTDLLIENTHFIRNKTSAQDLGYKSLAVNLSDIAAMGGKPQYAFLSLGLPANTSIQWTDDFFKGFQELAKTYNVLLLGGDTTRSEHIVVNVLVMGVIPSLHIKKRSDAKAGDIICCTGFLGDSAAGLKIMMENLPIDAQTERLVKAHLHPKPHLEEGSWLAIQSGVHAMIDISDGLASDILHIMEESHCGAHLELENLPFSPQFQSICYSSHWPAKLMALTGGEDYCLLVTIHPSDYSNIQQAYQKQFHQPLFKLGTILSSPKLIYTQDQKPFELNSQGFDHFKML